MQAKTIVLATFDNEASADAAAGELRNSKITKGDAIGVLVLDDNGQVKTEKVGKRSVGKGAGIGLVLAAFTPVGAGAVVGGAALGALHHKNLGLVTLGIETKLAEFGLGNIPAPTAKGHSLLDGLDRFRQAQGLLSLGLQEMEGQALGGLLSDSRQPDQFPDQSSQKPLLINAHE